MTMIEQKEITVMTCGRSIIDITADVAKVVDACGCTVGSCHVFIQHTSASLLISENADPAVLRDLEMYLSALVKDGHEDYTHTQEGKDDMAAHIRSMLTQTSLTIPVGNQRLLLGTWQAVYLWEHRYRGFERRMVITVIG